jgi:hypothetical protein
MILAPICLAISVIGAFIALVVGLVMLGQRQRRRSLENFARLAQHYGLTLHGSHHMGGAFGRGRLEVILATESRGSGKNRRTVNVTRYRMWHPARLRMGLKVTTQTAFFGDIADALGLVKDIKVGRSDLDDVVRIAAVDPNHASAVLVQEPVARALIVARNLGRFIVSDDEAFAQHDGWVGDGVGFEGFARPLQHVVDALAESRTRNRASWEAEVDRAWGALVDTEGFHYVPEHTVLRASTPAGTVELAVGVVGATLATHARISVARPLGHGIQMTRAGALTSVGKLFGMQDITLGAPMLDDAYVIKATNEQGARATLLAVSGDLLKLHEAFGEMKVFDGGLDATRTQLLLDRVELTALLRAMLRIADGLAGQSPQPQSAFR